MMLTSEADARQWVLSQPEADAVAVERLERLIACLREENLRQNLVASASLASVWQRHIADSAQLLRHVPRGTSGPWLDLGTGAGFPGLVLAVLNPDRRLLMVESRARRIEWLERMINGLELSQAQVIGKRLEAIPTMPVAVISARAFAPLDRLLELSARFSTSNTLWVLPKGRSARDEVTSLSGWRHTFHVEQSLTNPDAGVVVGTVAGARSASNKQRR